MQGKGFATASVRAIVGYAASLGGTEIFAGVNRGNLASRAVLRRCGFETLAELDTYTRFHRLVTAS